MLQNLLIMLIGISPNFLPITINVERFAGLNIHGFNPMKFFAEIISCALATSVYYLPIVKNSRENFHGTLKNCENRESLAQRIFPRLQYAHFYS